MDWQTKIIDLTSSDNDDSDTEMLSLQERILLMEKGKKCNKTVSPLKRLGSTPDIEKTDSNEKEDSDPEFELPNLGALLGVHHKSQSSANEFEEKFTILPEVPENLYSKQLSEAYAVQQNNNSPESEEEFNLLLEAPKRTKKAKPKQDTDFGKEIAKEEKLKLREEKKQEKKLAKALKASEKELQKSKKPDECLKGMKVILDQSIIFENESEDIFFALDGANLKYNIEENPINMSVIWCRTVVDVTVDKSQVVKQEREELENTLLLVINNENFVRMVNATTQKMKGKFDDHTSLVDHISNIKSMFPVMDITCVVIGLDKYQRSVKENDMCSSELKKISKQVSKAVIEEATIEVQIQAFVNFNFLTNMREFGDMLARFSKAIAEAPQRREKHLQKSLSFSWYADADSSCPVKLGKDGDGLIKLWQQQIRQFNNVGPEVAEAIVSQYPSLHSLMQGYHRCHSKQEAERLLQDIVVRRNYGPLGTQRRIGPKLSYKIYLFYTSRDGDQLLQR